MAYVKLKFFSFLLILFGFWATAQNDPWISDDQIAADSVLMQMNDMVRSDTVPVDDQITDNSLTERNIGTDFRNRYKSGDFDYEQKQPRKSIWQRIKERLQEILKSIFGDVDFSSADNITKTALRIFAVLLLAFLLYFLIRYVLGKEGRLFFARKNSQNNLNSGDLHEDIHEINFQQVIAKAESDGDYRSAVRYRFLWVLKLLADKKLIMWNREKTNRDYVREIAHLNIHSGFKEVAHIFDHVWYGEFKLTKEHYEQVRKKFDQLKF